MVNRTYIIAEAGVNHNGSLEMAKLLIDEAADAGASAVKFQTFKAENVISKDAPKAEYQIQATDSGESQLEMVKKFELSEADHRKLITHCKTKKIEFLSSPFDLESVDLLTNRLRLFKLKIPSGEITNAPLLLKAARSGKSLIVSTGMSTLGEVELALGILAFGYLDLDERPSISAFQRAWARKTGQEILRKKITLLQCTTDYPTPYPSINLRSLVTLKAAFGIPVGFSDHSPGIIAPIASVSMGATVVEKHFTLDRNLPGPDHKSSLEPEELKEMVKSIRIVEKALGNSVKTPDSVEIKNQMIARKSIVTSNPIREGEVFTEKNLTTKRPGNGISPINFWSLLGKKATRDYDADEVL